MILAQTADDPLRSKLLNPFGELSDLCMTAVSCFTQMSSARP
jgi:hypothetical protein